MSALHRTRSGAATRRRGDLRRDDRGALMVSGVFMMILSVALLYFMIGTVKTLQAREGMQDAADASAFAAAVFMARGMNLIALINLLMASLVAILVAIRLTQTFFQVSATLLFSGAWYFGLTAPAATACQTLATNLNQAYKQAKDPIFEVIEVLHDVQEATSVVVPFVALGAGMLEAAQHHPPADGAFALPAPDSLPVESDEFPVLCAHATDMAVTGALEQFTFFLPEEVGDWTDKLLMPIEKAAQGIGQTTSAYLCGQGGGSPPPQYSFKTDRAFPEPDGAEACEEDAESDRCQEVSADWEASKPNPVTGECLMRCNYDDPYEALARKARVDCEPGVNGYAKEYVWQEATVETTWIYTSKRWAVREQHLDQLTYHKTARPPCGLMGTIDRATWNHDSGDRAQDHPDFLCGGESRSPNIEEPREGQTWSAPPVQAALRVFSCVFEKKESVDLAEETQKFGGDQGDERSPQRMQDVELGSETFQVRSIAFGPAVGPGKALDGVRVALMGKEPAAMEQTVFDAAQVFNRFSIAQAEYFYDGDENAKKEDWLWEMRWRARMVRVRLPTNEEKQAEEERQQGSGDALSAKIEEYVGEKMGDSLEEVCGAVTNECPTEQELADFSSLVIH